MSKYQISSKKSLKNNKLLNLLIKNGYKKLDDFKSSINGTSIGYFINKIDKCFYLIDKSNFMKISKTLKDNENEIVVSSDFLKFA